MDDNNLKNNNDFTYPSNSGTSNLSDVNNVKPSSNTGNQSVSQQPPAPGAIPLNVSSENAAQSDAKASQFDDDPFGLNDSSKVTTNDNSNKAADVSANTMQGSITGSSTPSNNVPTSGNIKPDNSLIPGNLLNNVVSEKESGVASDASSSSSSIDSVGPTNSPNVSQQPKADSPNKASTSPSLTVEVENGLQNSADASVLEQIEKAEKEKQNGSVEGKGQSSPISDINSKVSSNLSEGMVSAPITDEDLKENDLENKLEEVPLDKPVDVDEAISVTDPQEVIPQTLDQKQDLSKVKTELKNYTSDNQSDATNESLTTGLEDNAKLSTGENSTTNQNTNLEPTTEPINSVELDSSNLENLSGPAEFDGSIESLLEIVIERNASDLHLTAGYPPFIRVDGVLQPIIKKVLSKDSVKSLIYALLSDDRRKQLEANREIDFAYEFKGGQRFRINAYYQKGSLAAALRLIPNKIRSIDELKLPQIYHQFARLGQGLVLVTGPTGHGKTTTLAAIIQEINENRGDHIITIEDPIEYVYPKAKSLVDQREMHDDTLSWAVALRSALREDPDVVLVGEMRDLETIASAITLAETGHLVFATLHTNNAAQSIDRIIDVFPEHQQSQVRAQLADIIEVVIAQRLVPINGGGRRAVSEIMIATPAIRNLIREGKTPQIDNVIRTSADIGMTSLESSLVKLIREGLINVETAQRYASHPEEITRLMKI